mmetsp:Transcript_8992/g.27495  ORF Transcript_8992/g.27495 Transcript_8992/m.27495 type:complete len:223 (+) Transcript_8992:400-1068(+)
MRKPLIPWQQVRGQHAASWAISEPHEAPKRYRRTIVTCRLPVTTHPSEVESPPLHTTHLCTPPRPKTAARRQAGSVQMAAGLSGTQRNSIMGRRRSSSYGTPPDRRFAAPDSRTRPAVSPISTGLPAEAVAQRTALATRPTWLGLSASPSSLVKGADGVDAERLQGLLNLEGGALHLDSVPPACSHLLGDAAANVSDVWLLVLCTVHVHREDHLSTGLQRRL